MMSGDFRTEVVNEVAHRPWPMPNRPWLLTQTWHDLLFAHWPVDPAQLHASVPHALPLDRFDGQAWVGIVPFRMANVGPRGVPSLPFVSAFPELNVRTYVRVGDRPGVCFFSLDAASALAVRTARALLNLPYYTASMSVTPDGDGVTYHSQREGRDDGVFIGSYRPTGPAFTASPGTLEYFLTERYCLYHVDRHGAPYRLQIHHPPWLLQPAELDLSRNTMATVNGLVLPDSPPLLHFARRQDTIAWAPSRL